MTMVVHSSAAAAPVERSETGAAAASRNVRLLFLTSRLENQAFGKDCPSLSDVLKKAGEGSRTLNSGLGKPVLCQLSYARKVPVVYTMQAGWLKGTSRKTVVGI